MCLPAQTLNILSPYGHTSSSLSQQTMSDYTSLQDLLSRHTFQQRGFMHPPTATQASTSNTTTVPKPALVAACLRAADPTNPTPSITFELSDQPLGSLSQLLSDTLIPNAPIPPLVLSHLTGTETTIGLDTARDEAGQYSLVLYVYAFLTTLLISEATIFLHPRPPFRSWHSASAPNRINDGKGDFEVRELDEDGLPRRSSVLWEYKRNLVLLLYLLRRFLQAARRQGGVQLTLSPNGETTLGNSVTEELDDHIRKWCCQVN